MNSETQSAIAVEMRTYFQTQKRNGNPEHRPWHQVLTDWADRIEAATAEKSIAQKKPKIEQPGNATALREAVEKWIDIPLPEQRYNMSSDGFVEVAEDESRWLTYLRKMLKELRAALAAPSRNCDVGTAEEQTVRYRDFCNRMLKQNNNCCGPCPCFEFVNGEAQPCTLLWAQMPYENEEGAK